MPNTREKLIELIRMPIKIIPDAVISPHITFTLPYAEDLADHLIAHGVTAQKWIPVTERLPALHTDDYKEPDGSRVQFEVSDDQWVITTSGYRTKARYETGVVFQGWVGEFGETVRNVTHWMPMPEPPSDDQ